jgi:hypothetical protein
MDSDACADGGEWDLDSNASESFEKVPMLFIYILSPASPASDSTRVIQVVDAESREESSLSGLSHLCQRTVTKVSRGDHHEASPRVVAQPSEDAGVGSWS